MIKKIHDSDPTQGPVLAGEPLMGQQLGQGRRLFLGFGAVAGGLSALDGTDRQEDFATKSLRTAGGVGAGVVLTAIGREGLHSLSNKIRDRRRA